MTTALQEKLRARIAALRAEQESKKESKKESKEESKEPKEESPSPSPSTLSPNPAPNEFTWHENQLRAIELASELKPFVLIGAAGTGKSTVQREIVSRIISNSGYRTYPNCESKYIKPNAPAIAVVGFTNRSVENIRRIISVSMPEISSHCLTIHKLIEFVPTIEEEYDEVKEEFIQKKIFRPTFTEQNPLPDIKIIIIEEASMVSTELFAMLRAGCPNAMFMFLGDLNQIPPVFGDAILGYKLSELPVVELTKVYRQAMGNPIVAFQHNYTLAGKLPSDTEMARITEQDSRLRFVPFKKELKDHRAMSKAVSLFMKKEYDEGKYNPDQDIILCPFNKKFGCDEINKHIAQWHGELSQAVVHEIVGKMGGIATKRYFAVGDKVMFAKQEYTITGITRNAKYKGEEPQVPSSELTREGKYKDGKLYYPHGMSSPMAAFTSDFDFMEQLNESKEDEDSSQQISHCIELTHDYEQTVEVVSSRGQLSIMEFRYAISIHKSQGSQWPSVYIVMTNAHSIMMNRELLYTAMTRAETNCIVIHSPQSVVGKRDSSIAKAIKRQAIPGKTWQEKAEYFKGKAQA